MNEQFIEENPTGFPLYRVGHFLSLLSVIFILLFLLLSLSASSATIDDDMIITDTVEYEGSNLTMKCNISIRDGGSLVFKRCNVTLDRYIYIDSGGRLEFEESFVALDVWDQKQFMFLRANASTILIFRGVELSSNGWWTFGGGYNYYIIFRGDEFIVEDSTIRPSGIKIQLLQPKKVLIRNSTFRNQDGVVITDCPNVVLSDTRFIAPWNSRGSNIVTWGPVVWGCDQVEITGCSFSYYLYYQVQIDSCTNVTMTSCIIDGNHTKGENRGLDIEQSVNLRISNLTVSRSTSYGINIERCSDVVVRNSTIMYNQYGLRVSHTQGLEIRSCALSNNKLAFESHNLSDGILHLNAFFHNQQDAVDDALSRWDSNGRGNYWDMYAGPDANSDGIGDIPHPIPNNSIDRHPLMTPIIIAPFQLIGSQPEDGEREVNTQEAILLTFNLPMTEASIIDAIIIEPQHDLTLRSVSGWGYQWHVIVSPETYLEGSTRYTITIGTSLKDIFNRSLLREYMIVFYTMDDDPPIIELVSPTNGSWIRPGVPIVIKVEERNLDYLVATTYFGSETFRTDTIMIPTKEWVDGPVTLSISARDDSGNLWEGNFSFFIDGTPPNLVELSPANGSYLSNISMVIVTFSDAIGIEIWFNSTEASYHFESSRLEVSVGDWQEGATTFELVAVDMVGNRFYQQLEYTVDRISPVISLIYPEEGAIVTKEQSIELVVQDPALFEAFVRIQGSESIGVQWDEDGKVEVGIDIAEEGPLPVTFHAFDLAGNEQIRTYWFELDTIPPAIKFSLKAVGQVLQSNELVHVTVIDDNPESATLSIDSVVLSDGRYSSFVIPLSTLDEGRHQLDVSARDKAGHLSNESIYFVIDDTPPGILILEPEYGPYFSSGDHIRILVDETNSCRIITRMDEQDEYYHSSYDLLLGLKSLQNGSHKLVVQGVDAAGNVAEVSFEFILDNQAPTITIELVDGQRVSRGQDVGVIINDTLAYDAWWRVDETNWSEFSSSMNLTISADISTGEHKLYFKALDLVGNNRTEEVIIIVIQDQDPPDSTGSVIWFGILVILLLSVVFSYLLLKQRQGGDMQ